jgi:uncharacterized protein
MDRKKMDEKIQEVADKIAKEFQPEKIILFGSWAWGEPDEDSDVDLFIVKDSHDDRLTRRRKLRSLLFGNDFPPMDVLVYTPEEVEKSVNEYKNLFIEDILRHGKVFYVKPESIFAPILPRRPLAILH